MNINWLLYIGGYSVFTSIINCLHGLEYYALYGKPRMTEGKVDRKTAVFMLDMLSTLLLWIYICKTWL